jgi:hypothetical protein
MSPGAETTDTAAAAFVVEDVPDEAARATPLTAYRVLDP